MKKNFECETRMRIKLIPFKSVDEIREALKDKGCKITKTADIILSQISINQAEAEIVKYPFY